MHLRLMTALLMVGLATPAADAVFAQGADDRPAPRTPWGDPDLQGTWTNATSTPMERPGEYEGRTELTDEERAELDARAASNRDRQPPPGDPGAYNSFWVDRTTRSARTSLLIDPPDGRCARADAAAAMIPGFYNHNYQIFQTPNHVVILVEMIHDARIIPLDGRPQLSLRVRQWMGDSRAHWEGDTLVVETRNVSAKADERAINSGRSLVLSGSEEMTLVERFRRLDADTIDYRFTLTDPITYTEPWTAAIPMARLEAPIFEYACHEGNYGMMNILRGARAAE